MRIKLFGLVGTSGLADGAVTNVKVNAAAAIASSKLDLSAIAQDLAASGSRTVGTLAAPFTDVYIDPSGGTSGAKISSMIQQALLF